MQTSKCGYLTCVNNLNSIPVDKKYPCAYCNMSFYCSINCRILDWETFHKRTCKYGPPLTENEKETSPAPTDTSLLDTSSLSTNSGKKRSLQDYEIVNLNNNKFITDLGKGSFGQVKLVKEKAHPDKLYALKIINKKHLIAYSNIDCLKREVKIQRKLDHPHIVKLHHYFEDKENVYLVLEYAENGNLFFYLRRKRRLSEGEAFVYFFQTCLGIDYLHKKGILHRDLKPENLLLDKDKNIKLCDFGYSAEAIGKRDTFCGTVDYMAPEIVQKGTYNYKIDLWSLGVLLYELLHGYPPFKGMTNDEKFKAILDNKIVFDGISKEAEGLIKALLISDPEHRAGFDQIFGHTWFKKYEREFKVDIKAYIYQSSPKKGMNNVLDKSYTEEPDKDSSKKELNKTQETPKPYNLLLKGFAQEFSPISHSQAKKDNFNEILKNHDLSPKPFDYSGLSPKPQVSNFTYYTASESGVLKGYKPNTPTLETSIIDKSPVSLSTSPLYKKDGELINKDNSSFLESSTLSKSNILDLSISKETSNPLGARVPKAFLELNKSSHNENNGNDKRKSSTSPSCMKGENKAQRIIEELMGSLSNTPRSRSPLNNEADNTKYNKPQALPRSFTTLDKSYNNDVQELKRTTTHEFSKVEVQVAKQQGCTKVSSIEITPSGNTMASSSTRKNKFLQDFSYPVSLNEKPKSIQAIKEELAKDKEIGSSKGLMSTQINETSTSSKAFDLKAAQAILPSVNQSQDYSKLAQKGDYGNLSKVTKENERALNKKVTDLQSTGISSNNDFEDSKGQISQYTKDLLAIIKSQSQTFDSEEVPKKEQTEDTKILSNKNLKTRQNDQKKPDLIQTQNETKNTVNTNTICAPQVRDGKSTITSKEASERKVKSKQSFGCEDHTEVQKDKAISENKTTLPEKVLKVEKASSNVYKSQTNVVVKDFTEDGPSFGDIDMSFGNYNSEHMKMMMDGPQLLESLNANKPAWSLQRKDENVKEKGYQVQESKNETLDLPDEEEEEDDLVEENDESSEDESEDIREKEAALETLNSSLNTEKFIRRHNPVMAQRIASDKDHLSDLKEALKLSEQKRYTSDAVVYSSKKNLPVDSPFKVLFKHESKPVISSNSEPVDLLSPSPMDSSNKRYFTPTQNRRTVKDEGSNSPYGGSLEPNSNRRTKSKKDFEVQRETLLNDYKARFNNLSTFARATTNNPSCLAECQNFTDEEKYQTRAQKTLGSRAELLNSSPQWRNTSYRLQGGRGKDNEDLRNMMEDFEWEENEKVSRPSVKMLREIPQVQEKAKNNGGFFMKITSMIGCVSRNDGPVVVVKRNSQR